MKKYPFIKEKVKNYERFGLENIDMSEAAIIVFEQNEFLFHEGDELKYIMFILSGRAKVSLSIPNGKQMLLDYFITDGVVGDLELFMGCNRAYTTMQAITELECIGLPLDKYAVKLKADIAFLNWAGHELAEKMIKSDIHGVTTILQRLEPRLCAYILNSAHNGVLRETMTDVADLLGTSYRHLLRSLNKLCSENLISKQKTGYIIINEEELNKRALEM